MKKRLRTLLVWIIISLVFQFSAYSYLESKVEAVTKPVPPQIITKTLTADIPGTNLENIQLSYSKDYLAYMQNGIFKVYNLVQQKVVFEKDPPAGSAKNMGVLNYEWLPDRNILIYFYARKNPNPVTITVVQPPASSSQSSQSTKPAQPDKSTQPTQTQKPGQSTQPAQSAKSTGQTKPTAHIQGTLSAPLQGYSDSDLLRIQAVSAKTVQETSPQTTGQTSQSKQETSQQSKQENSKASTQEKSAQSTSQTQQTTQTTQTTTGISQELPKTEDPNQKQSDSKDSKNEKDAQPITETHYNNPQLTDLYTLELPDSNDTAAKPDDRFNQTLSSFPAGGEITHLEFSTYTNLMYLAVKVSSGTQLFRIDIMKDVLNLSRSGESIPNMAVSDQYGTLYIEAKSGNTKQIVLIDGWNRTTISQNPDYTILGDRSGTLYLGELKNGNLIKIMSLTETSTIKANPSLDTVWQGSLPFTNASVLIGMSKQIVIYNSTTANIIKDGTLNSVDLHGDASYISPDGAELAQLTKEDDSTHIELRPL